MCIFCSCSITSNFNHPRSLVATGCLILISKSKETFNNYDNNNDNNNSNNDKHNNNNNEALGGK